MPDVASRTTLATEPAARSVPGVPRIDDVTLEALMSDPYPIFRRLQAEAPVAEVPAAGGLVLVTRFADVHAVERDPRTFASTNPGSLMNQVMGHSLMRKDGEAHALERRAVEPSFRPGTAKRHWTPRFERLASAILDDLAPRGEADLFDAFAAPLAACALADLLGFGEAVAWRRLAGWSQAMMDAVGNYAGDPEVARRGREAAEEVDAAIEAALPGRRAAPDPSILSSMLTADPPQSIEQIRANVKVIIGGGLNEPRDAILSAALALLTHPEQRGAVEADPALWPVVFEETVRWIAPIGMYPRRVTGPASLGGVPLRGGEQLGICVGAANRDPSRFDDPDRFDIHRPKVSHLGFGAGPHFCAGTWVARQLVGQVALPMLFARLPGLRLDGEAPMRGWVFRGPTALPARWDA